MNGYGSAIPKHFNKRLRNIGIEDRKLVLYSLRHNVTTQLADKGIEAYLIERIVSHRSEGQTFGRYTKDIDVLALRGAVERLEFPIDFEFNLYHCPGKGSSSPHLSLAASLS